MDGNNVRRSAGSGDDHQYYDVTGPVDSHAMYRMYACMHDRIILLSLFLVYSSFPFSKLFHTVAASAKIEYTRITVYGFKAALYK